MNYKIDEHDSDLDLLGRADEAEAYNENLYNYLIEVEHMDAVEAWRIVYGD